MPSKKSVLRRHIHGSKCSRGVLENIQWCQTDACQNTRVPLKNDPVLSHFEMFKRSLKLQSADMTLINVDVSVA